MKKLYIYKSGERFFGEPRAIFMPIGGKLLKEVDLKKATKEEMQSLLHDPHNDTLLSQIEKRK